MFIVLLTVQILVCIAMIGVILLQRSEGGGLGLGTGGGVGGLMTGRGAANALTRTTVILATIFIVTSIALTFVAKRTREASPLAPAGTQNQPLTPLGPSGGLLPSTPSEPAPAQPSSSNPSTVPVPTTTPQPSAPATPSGAQPAPSSSAPATPSGSGN